MALDVIDLEATKRAAQREATTEQNPFGWKPFAQLWLDPMPSERWVCKGLELGPGRPCGLWGFGSAGKTAYSMALCLAVASGRLAFDRFEVQPGTACYVSHEMGSFSCIQRIRRIANGMLLEPSDLIRFKLSIYPEVMLNSRDAESIYAREFEKISFAVLDSLRGALPGVDEDKSFMAQYLELLTRVSERTGTSFLTLHHTTKEDVKGAVEGARRDKRLSGRGSSVIFDKSNSIWLLEGSGNHPRTLTQIRSHDDGDGVSESYLVELTKPYVEHPTFDSNRPPINLQIIDRSKRPEIKPMDRIRGEIMALVLETPGISTNSITSRVSGKDGQKRTALKELEVEGLVVTRDGPREAKLYYPANGSNGAPDSGPDSGPNGSNGSTTTSA